MPGVSPRFFAPFNADFASKREVTLEFIAFLRAAYASGLAAYLEAFAKASGAERAEAIRMFAGLVGALTLARSVAASDPALSDEILGSAGEPGL